MRFSNPLVSAPLWLFFGLISSQCIWPEKQCKAILSLESSECQDIHAFLVRGTDAKVPGRQGELVRLVCQQSKGSCGYENVQYSARSRFVGDDAWCESAAQGAAAGQKQMTDYAQRCPDSKLVLLGFSQGASVAMDVIGGGGGSTFKCTQAENAALNRTTIPGANIAAVAVFGSVRRSANQVYTVKGGKPYDGTSTRSNMQLQGLNEYADILRDYCNDGDYMCAPKSHDPGMEKHLSYFDQYQDEIAQWIAGTVRSQQKHDHTSNKDFDNFPKYRLKESLANLEVRPLYGVWVGALLFGILFLYFKFRRRSALPSFSSSAV